VAQHTDNGAAIRRDPLVVQAQTGIHQVRVVVQALAHAGAIRRDPLVVQALAHAGAIRRDPLVVQALAHAGAIVTTTTIHPDRVAAQGRTGKTHLDHGAVPAHRRTGAGAIATTIIIHLDRAAAPVRTGKTRPDHAVALARRRIAAGGIATGVIATGMIGGTTTGKTVGLA
jgi:hypothetical protein